jgi:hypothetical protein
VAACKLSESAQAVEFVVFRLGTSVNSFCEEARYSSTLSSTGLCRVRCGNQKGGELRTSMNIEGFDGKHHVRHDLLGLLDGELLVVQAEEVVMVTRPHRVQREPELAWP